MRWMIFVMHFSVLPMAQAQLKGAVSQEKLPKKAEEKREVVVQSPTEIAKENAEKLRKSLRLTEDQYQSLLKAFTEYEVAVHKVTKSALSKQEKFDKTNLLSAARRKKMKAILTPEQYKAYLMSFP
jgi:Spy/CpxP family protein refolding chaperone